MCRLLAIKSQDPVDLQTHLESFAEIARDSKEYQGHGWGLAFLEDNNWQTYHNINPVWKDEFTQFGKVRTVLIHARSAFKDEGIEIENNMPFVNNDLAFIFNGELRKVRIQEQGRIGAEKIFNFIQRFRKQGMRTAIDRAIPIIEKRSGYIRAMNFVIADSDKFYISNYYNEEPDYFNLYRGSGDGIEIISSQPYDFDGVWKEVENYTVEVM